MDKKTKQYLILGGVGIGGIAGFVLFKKFRDKEKNKAAVKAIAKGNTTQLGINVPEIAKQIGIDMGYAYPAWDVRRWTENDTAVQILVTKVPKPLIPTLIKEYARFYPGRNLQSDLQEKLDAYNEVSYLFK
jgi:hypothetical protein